MPVLPHRDEFVGVLTEQLSKSGSLGVDIAVYSFAAVKDSKSDVFHFRKEESCVEKMLSLYNSGWIVSELLRYHEFAVDSASVDWAQLEQCAKAFHGQSVFSFFQENMSAGTCADGNLREEAFTAYLSSHTDNTYGQLESLLGIALHNGRISNSFAAEWRSRFHAKQNGRFFGFVYWEDGQKHTFANGYLPNVWVKWQSKTGSLRSGIFTNLMPPGNSPFALCKNECEKLLLSLMDDEYIALLQ